MISYHSVCCRFLVCYFVILAGIPLPNAVRIVLEKYNHEKLQNEVKLEVTGGPAPLGGWRKWLLNWRPSKSPGAQRHYEETDLVLANDTVATLCDPHGLELARQALALPEGSSQVTLAQLEDALGWSPGAAASVMNAVKNFDKPSADLVIESEGMDLLDFCMVAMSAVSPVLGVALPPKRGVLCFNAECSVMGSKESNISATSEPEGSQDQDTEPDIEHDSHEVDDGFPKTHQEMQDALLKQVPNSGRIPATSDPDSSRNHDTNRVIEREVDEGFPDMHQEMQEAFLKVMPSSGRSDPNIDHATFLTAIMQLRSMVRNLVVMVFDVYPMPSNVDFSDDSESAFLQRSVLEGSKNVSKPRPHPSKPHPHPNPSKPHPHPSKPRPLVRAHTFEQSIPTDWHEILTKDVQHAQAWVTTAYRKAGEGWEKHPLLKDWFEPNRPLTQNELRMIRHRLSQISAILAGLHFRFGEECKPMMGAYVNPRHRYNQRYVMNMCGLYFGLKLYGSRRTFLLIHESSHHAGTDDIVYGVIASQGLALAKGFASTYQNADNFAYFVWLSTMMDVPKPLRKIRNMMFIQ